MLNGQNIYATITPDMLAALLNKTLLNHQIVSRDTILTWIEALKNPRDRFMILSIFIMVPSSISLDLVPYGYVNSIVIYDC